MAHRRGGRTRARGRSFVRVVLVMSAVALGLSACAASTPLDHLLAENGAETGPCLGPVFGPAINVADFECWRVTGVDDIEAFTHEVAAAVNGGVAPDPDRSKCISWGGDAYVSCAIDLYTDDSWFTVEVVRDLYSTERDALAATGHFPPGSPVTIVIARSTTSYPPSEAW